ncbi:MAG: hypothetical protein WBA41_19520 [Rivularia sp. (in: cyanobacteria)]
MRYSLNLLAVASVFLITLPLEATVTDKPSVAKLSVASEFVKIAQVEKKLLRSPNYSTPLHSLEIKPANLPYCKKYLALK